MVRRSLIISLALLGLLLAAWPAAAQNKKSSYTSKWWRNLQVQKELQLSPAEQRQLDDLNLKLRREVIELRSQMQESRVTLESYFDRDPLDLTAIQREQEKYSQARAALTLTRSRFLLEARKMLGLERYQKLRRIFQQFREKRRNKTKQ